MAGKEREVSDVGGGSGIDWNGPITIILTGLVSLLVEYFRRKMPEEKHDRRKDDPHDNDSYDENERELEEDDV
jgi:hypothetical protein